MINKNMKQICKILRKYNVSLKDMKKILDLIKGIMDYVSKEYSKIFK